MSDSKQGI